MPFDFSDAAAYDELLETEVLFFMLQFKLLTLEDMTCVRPWLGRARGDLCDFTAATVFLWRRYFQTAFCMTGEALYFRIRYPDGAVHYTVPILSENGDLTRAFRELEAHVRETGTELFLSPLSAEQAELLPRYFETAEITAERDWADYLYDADKLQTFPGKKLHGMRNHLHQFDAAAPDARAEAITAGQIPLCLRFLAEYEREQAETADFSDTARGECEAVREALCNYDLYDFLGTCIVVSGEVAAFALGSEKDGVLYEHVEKATRRIPGAYQKIVSEFARMYAHPAKEGVYRINREDDMGDLSLRKSKLAYQPSAFAEKFRARAANVREIR